MSRSEFDANVALARGSWRASPQVRKARRKANLSLPHRILALPLRLLVVPLFGLFGGR